jgi:hypothetical protein
MMNTGTVNSSCSKGGAVDGDDDCSCGMMERTQETFGATCCSAAGDNRGIAGTSGYGMMGGTWGQASAGGAGRYGGWAALGFALVIILIIIWIIVGILLILHLYRKLSIK